MACEYGKGSTFTIDLDPRRRRLKDDFPDAAAEILKDKQPSDEDTEPALSAEQILGDLAAKEAKPQPKPKRDRDAEKVSITVKTKHPFAETTEPTGTLSALRRVLPVEAGKRILIIDDDPDAREFIGQYLTDLGAKYEECGDPTEALDKARSYKPDLITLDIMMPQVNGWEVLGRLKNDAELSKIPVVIVSMVADRNKAVSLGALDALSKPVERDDFLACARRALNSDRVEGRKILVVDDFVQYQTVMKLWLDEESNDIRTASNGEEALKVLEDFTPEVIFLDLMMPIMDGMEFLQELRSDERWASIPVIVITGKNLSRKDREMLNKQASQVLTKAEALRTVS